MTILSKAFNVATLHIAQRLNPMGWDILDNAPSNLKDACAYTREHGRIGVWSGASDKTIFGDIEINYAFRAWHDWCHILGGHEFTVDGECAVAQEQKSHIRQLYGDCAISAEFCKLIECEVLGQLAYEQRWGRFPADQLAFTLEYLRQPSAALATVY